MRRNDVSLKVEDGPETDVLIVEGADDFFALKELLTKFKLLGKIRLEEGGGYSRIRESIDTRVDGSNLERFGVIVDADEDIRARWESISGAFKDAGYVNMPVDPDPLGTIITRNGYPTIGIWIMPDNQLPGEIEDFIRLLVPSDDTLWLHAENAVANIPPSERLFKDSVAKALLHTWLAWQKEPGKPIGLAIIKRYLSTETNAALQLKNWLLRLFLPN